MRVELDLPDWCEGKNLYVLAGIELAAYAEWGSGWKVKTSRCDFCGKCCIEMKDGPCEHLVQNGKEWLCGLGGSKPWICCISRGEDCAERFD